MPDRPANREHGGGLRLRNVTLYYPPQDKHADHFLAVDSVDLKADGGEFVSVVGPSGCGKSSLLSILAGLRRPTSGEVIVAGEHVQGVRTDVGYIFQRDALLPWRTARENVALPLKFRGVAKREALERAQEALIGLGLGRFGDRYPNQLSGGQVKRVSIAATLVYEPSLLLMDEPFSALDVQTRDLIENDILAIWTRRSKQTVVFVTHDLEEAIALSDRVVVMTASPGRILADYAVDLPRPRDLMDIKLDPSFSQMYRRIWEDLRIEVMKAAEVDKEEQGRHQSDAPEEPPAAADASEVPDDSELKFSTEPRP